MIPHYIIHLDSATEREVNVIAAQALVPALETYHVKKSEDPANGCAQSHQDLVGFAKRDGVPAVCVFEDDVSFSRHFTWPSWCRRVEWFLESPFDILLGGAAYAGSVIGVPDQGVVEVQAFTSCHHIIYKASAYDTIIGFNPNKALDIAIWESNLRKVVTVPFLSVQAPSYSTIVGRNVDYVPWFLKVEAALAAEAVQYSTRIDFTPEERERLQKWDWRGLETTSC